MELSKRDQERIMRKSFRSSNIELSKSLLMTNADSIHKGKLAVGVLDFLKRHPTKAMKMRTRFASFVHGVCGTNIEDEDFFQWLCQRIGRKLHKVLNILNNHLETRGRRKLTEEERQVIVDTWHELSAVTVDRRNKIRILTSSKSKETCRHINRALHFEEKSRDGQMYTLYFN